jgi:hypothetical protein
MKARRINVNTMTITGLHGRKRMIERAAKSYATELQELVAKLFSNEKVAGGKLEPNSATYTAWKIKNGYSPKRGHLTGHTQDVLDSENLMRVKVIGTKGKYRVVISILRKVFYQLVGAGFKEYRSYIERYEQTKVPNETICALKPGWTRYAKKHFKEFENG